MKTRFPIKTFIIQLIISLGGGALIGFLTRDATERFSQTAAQPLFAPPDFLFPIVWSVLYILMAISATRIWSLKSNIAERNHALIFYYLQLAFNFAWSFIFFSFSLYLPAFFWIVALWILILIMIIRFLKLDRIAGIIQIPYMLWVTFAAVLNFSIYRLNP